MGLSICRPIIEAHEGRVWVTANLPRGAVFRFTLPLERDETVPAEHAGPMPAVWPNMARHQIIAPPPASSPFKERIPPPRQDALSRVPVFLETFPDELR